MKKFITTLAAAAFLAGPITATHALLAPAAHAQEGIGIIDVQRILEKSPLLKALENAQREVAQAEKNLIEFRNKKLKELQEKQANLTQEEFTKLKRKYEDEIMAKAKGEEQKLNKRKQEIKNMKEKLEKEVESIVKAVAQKKGLKMVINKQLVLFGGQDITADVIQEMNKR